MDLAEECRPGLRENPRGSFQHLAFPSLDVDLEDIRQRIPLLGEGVQADAGNGYSVAVSQDWNDAVHGKPSKACSDTAQLERKARRRIEPRRSFDDLNAARQVVSHRVFLNPHTVPVVGFEGKYFAGWSCDPGDGERKESDVRPNVVGDASRSTDAPEGLLQVWLVVSQPIVAFQRRIQTKLKALGQSAFDGDPHLGSIRNQDTGCPARQRKFPQQVSSVG